MLHLRFCATAWLLYVAPCSLRILENALGHMTVDEWLSGMRSESGSGKRCSDHSNGLPCAPSVSIIR